jgi:hypothetical protein
MSKPIVLNEEQEIERYKGQLKNLNKAESIDNYIRYMEKKKATSAKKGDWDVVIKLYEERSSSIKYGRK